MIFWGIFFIGVIQSSNHKNDIYLVVQAKKNFSLRYELPKSAFLLPAILHPACGRGFL